MQFSNHPYQVLINQISLEIEEAKLSLPFEDSSVELYTSIFKIIGICEIILALNLGGCFKKEYFKRMKQIITWKLQELIDVCPTGKKNSQEIYKEFQFILNSWMNERFSLFGTVYQV